MHADAEDGGSGEDSGEEEEQPDAVKAGLLGGAFSFSFATAELSRTRTGGAELLGV